MMDPHSLRPPARRRRGREGDQAVLEAGNAGGGARAPSVGRGGGYERRFTWLVEEATNYLYVT